VYASSKEIYQYFSDFAEKHQLGQYIKTEHQIVGANWDDERAKWVIEVLDIRNNRTFIDTCDIFINAGGILNSWRWPAIPGLDSFKKPILHSAAWDDSVDLRGKNVGLIGNGFVSTL
jgi:cation diffusion facilitator CzcD-associated flavoprotein CzcO